MVMEVRGNGLFLAASQSKGGTLGGHLCSSYRQDSPGRLSGLSYF